MALSVDEIRESAATYFAKLDAFIKQYDLAEREPSTIAWKVTGMDEYCDDLSGFLKSDSIAQCHIGFVDNRYIASIVFKKPLYRNVRILKLMQRRPQSTDPTGLDHADFAVENLLDLESELSKHKVPKWTRESNEVHGWVSVWFDNTEAKFVDHIVLDVCVKELQDTTKELGFKLKAVEFPQPTQ